MLYEVITLTDHRFDIAIQGDLLDGLGTADLPGVAVFAPGIGAFDLTALMDA